MPDKTLDKTAENAGAGPRVRTALRSRRKQTPAENGCGETNIYQNASNKNPRSDDSQHLATAVDLQLRKHMADNTLETLAKETGLGRQTIDNILLGVGWPDIRTVARPEVALKKRLWGKEHLDAAAERD